MYSETSEEWTSTGLKNVSVIERCLLLRGKKRLSHLGLSVLSAIHGVSSIWNVRYWEVSLYLDPAHLIPYSETNNAGKIYLQFLKISLEEKQSSKGVL